MEITPFNRFQFFGIYIDAYTNEKGDVKKNVYMPSSSKLGKDYCNVSESFIDKVFNKNTGQWIEPNGIAVMTEKSNLTVIDVDIPEKCIILERLLKDCKFYVKTRKGFHFYFNNTKQIPRRKLCGVADINTNILYYVPEYKHIETNEIYEYELVKSEKLIDVPQYVVDWCLTIISVRKNEPKVRPIKNCENIIIDSSIEITKFSLQSMKIIYEIFSENKLFDTYEGWRDIGYMSRHLNNSEEVFKLYDSHCRDVSGYENAPETNNRTAFYGKNEYNDNYDENGALFKCKKLNLEKYKECLQHLHVSRYKNEINYIDTEFIYNKSSVHMFDDWLSNHKVLAIKSPYGTGKTYAFKKIMDKNKFKRVLFITYRQSLAHSLTLELNERFGFDNYLDNNKVQEDGTKLNIKNSNRLIIQLDSLQKIVKPFNYLLQTDGIPSFDLVVLDEIEGLLNHLSYSQLNQHKTYNYLEKIIKRSSKILALDGDMNDRSYDFLSGLSDSYQLYVNNVKSIQKNFIFTHDNISYDKKIQRDLMNGRKIVIVCMSKTASEKYYALYKDDYKVCIHNSIEKNRNVLLNVKVEWSRCDLLIYSPTVESGVDFDVKNYFYKCYCVLSDKSTSHRALCQMINRVRHYESNDILCLLNDHLQWCTDDITYNYDEIRLTKYSGIEINNLVSILIHNDTEKINSSNYFISSFVQLIASKGHTYKYLGDAKPQIATVSGSSLVKKQIASADDITFEQYSQTINKMINNEDLSRDENNSFNKYLYSEAFALNSVSDVNEAFLEDHYNKMHIIKNVKALNMDENDRGEKKVKEYYKNFKFNKVDKIKELITKFGFQVEKNEISKITDVDKDVVKKEIETFLLDRKNRTLFNLGKESNIKYHFNDINNILESYGLVIKDIKKNVKIDKKVKSLYKANVEFIDIITSYFVRVKEQKKKESNEMYLQMINDPLNEGIEIPPPE